MMKNKILITIIACFFAVRGVCSLPDTYISYDDVFENSSNFEQFPSSDFNLFEETKFDDTILRSNIYDEDKEYYVCSDCGARIWGGADTPCANCKAATGMPVGNFPILLLLVVLSYVAIITVRSLERKKN